MSAVLEIAISMCLISAPEACRTQYVYTAGDADDESVIECVYSAPLYADAVMGQFPEYRLKEWRCRLAGDERKESDP